MYFNAQTMFLTTSRCTPIAATSKAQCITITDLISNDLEPKALTQKSEIKRIRHQEASSHISTRKANPHWVESIGKQGVACWVFRLRSPICLFTRTALSFPRSALFAWLACSAALIHLLAHSLTHPGAPGKEMIGFH